MRLGCSSGTMNISFTRPTKLPSGVVGLGAEDFGCVQHGCSFGRPVRAKKMPGTGEWTPATGGQKSALHYFRPGLASLSPHNSQVQRTDTDAGSSLP